MNIAICSFPTVGGSGIVASQLALELAKIGHNIHYISYDTPFLFRYRRHPNITLHLVDIVDYPLFKDICAPYTILCGSKMVNIARDYGIDLFHVHYAIPTGISVYLTKEITGVPAVITAHGSDIHTLGVDPAYNPLLSYVLNKIDGVSTVSNYMKEQIRKYFADRDEIEVIYNPIDTNKYKKMNIRTCDFKIKFEKNFVHVSNFRRVKNAPMIIEAFAEVAKEYRDVGLIMVGEGPERKKCEELASKLNIKDNVIFQGVRSSVVPIYNCAEALISASSNESFGLTLAEAMACEVPVIAPKVGGIPEVVDNGRNGLLFDISKKESLKEHMLTILNDPVLKAKMGKEGRRKVIDKFDSKKIAKQYLLFYQQVLGI